MTELHDLLHRATDRIDGPDLAARALTGARRRRARNRGVVAAVAAAAAVVAVVVSVELTTGGARVDQPPVLSPSPSPTQGVATAPAIDPSRIQPVWDPRTVEGLPVTDLGVPRVMESLVPGVVTRPVAVLDDGERARLVGGDEVMAELPLPDGLGDRRIVSLSPDGTQLAAVGISGFFWRTLDGDWEQVRHTRVSGEAPQVTWLPDGSGLIGRDWNSAVRVDLPSGDVEELPFPLDVGQFAVGPEGAVVATVPRQVIEWHEGREGARWATGPLDGLVLPAVGTNEIAFARANVLFDDERGVADRDGLIAVDRETFETRGYLPVPDDHDYYVHAEELRPVAWLDDDTVAFTVLPEGSPKEYLVTWNVETGALSRISCWEKSFSAVFATGLLGS
ncbi:hypothetical protein GCM10023350_43970 [Nocardioides endophyticus]|uniref:WD40 repeat domain-containing protein n=1 Tax=Nocardioides endophyticus TaxID=1353775 RepID=A0ABP8ZEX7_9ACTN